MEPAKNKECPIYEQLCTIFADSGVDGKYAQSSHYEEFDKSAGIDIQGNGSSPPNVSKSMSDKKRKRASEIGSISDQSHSNQELSDVMAEAFLDMIQSSRLRTAMKQPQNDEKFTITNCIRALDKIEGIEDDLYYAALDLFEKPDFREMFLSLQNNYIRLTWLQGKCGGFAPFTY